MTQKVVGCGFESTKTTLTQKCKLSCFNRQYSHKTSLVVLKIANSLRVKGGAF